MAPEPRTERAPSAFRRSDARAADGHGAGGQDAWARFGWLMGAIWLVFMVFPISSVLTVTDDWTRRGLGLAILALFAVVYLHGLWVDDRPEHALMRDTRWYVLALGLIALATVPIIGVGALGLIPFILSIAAITMPARQSLAVLGAALLLLLGCVLLVDGAEPLWFFFLIYPMVTLTLVLLATIDGAASRQRESRRQLGIAEERERVARDVHDVLGHSLTVVTVKSELAERLVDTDPERAKHEMAQVRDISRQALAEIRATVSGLRVARLADELTAARQALAGAGTTVEVIGALEDVDPRHRITVAWALREGVTNVVRHSGARHCEITLGEDRLVVTDDGRGVRGAREGNGIRGLRERVEPIGGSVRIEPAEPGTRVVVQL
ncbi:sensor histidine kinase [Marihabitans asiaticum]|uniref:Two-component system sensor histidine kinase DesK n=1 Tax=Marihabitans asiaticum TaxID=415218 RepID=A0A560W7W5_9MICO|nr:sensor histidine kinase [Marihabitans asiaticum]TWD13727.1 two-component system sensor histidine kinase DesK [Marihabitans asiaticum]